MRRRARAWFVVSVMALVSGCASLPSLEGRKETYAVTDTGATRLGRAVAPDVAAHPGKAGIHAMPVPTDAFAARVLLASAAEKSLDVQYYIWHGDQTGYLLYEAMWRAAERGVRVRILLDDANTKGLDETIATLAQVAGAEGAKVVYSYDFGDDWRHDIVVEKIIPAEPGVAYPRCTGGRRDAPPEDCGGIWVFNEQFADLGDLFTVGDLNERLADLATVLIPAR